ncbi:MAG: menaquinone biosynthesis protein, partial [Pyrinomonadaceae bacterium]
MRISASSYSNTAPLIWSFLYGKNHGKVELILDNAPSRSAELLAQNRVDAALVPVIAFQMIDGVRLIPDVCVGAKKRVRSVCLITKGEDLADVRSVALDTSSKTSAILTKIIFREFLGFEPEWKDAAPDLSAMLANSDAALLIGDPALSIADRGMQIADLSEPGAIATGSNPADRGMRSADLSKPGAIATGSYNPNSKIQNLKSFDLAELWHQHTGLGFVFAMWMTRHEKCAIDFAAARDEGLAHIDEIVANYDSEIGLDAAEIREYLSKNISYSIDSDMHSGMDLFFELASKNGFVDNNHKLS